MAFLNAPSRFDHARIGSITFGKPIEPKLGLHQLPAVRHRFVGYSKNNRSRVVFEAER